MPTPTHATHPGRTAAPGLALRATGRLGARVPGRSAVALLLAAGLSATTGTALAQAPTLTPAQAPAPAPGADDALRWFVEKEAAAQVQGMGRVEVRLGSIDPRLTLAPCRRIEPYLPPGTRLWGRTAIGIRCTEAATWSVSLPVTVTVRGAALVAASALQAGATPGPGDVRIEEIELTREPVAPLQDPSALAGKSLTRPVAAGQALRPDMLRAIPAVQAGDPVRLVLVGDGFSVTADGQALAPAADGQPVRVRTESGRVLTGKVLGRTVEIRL